MAMSGLMVALAFFAANVQTLFINGDIGLVFMAMEFNNAINFGLHP